MTSDGHAYTRLRRVLETRSSALLIRAAAAELPAPVPLEDALDICLALLELEPHTYPQTATRWGSRLAIERKLNLVDAGRSPRSAPGRAPPPRRVPRR